MNGITTAEARVLRAALLTYQRELDIASGSYSADPFPGRGDKLVLVVTPVLVVTLLADIEDFLKRMEDTDSTLEIWTDGAARPTNPGPAGIGIVGKVAGRTVLEIAQYIGRTTNNVAEYKAAVEGLRRAIDLGARKVILHSDSKLVVNQFLGVYRTNDQSLVPLLGRLRGLASRFETFEIKWIPRAENREADGLSVAGAYQPRQCGACRHDWHTSFCTEAADEVTGVACGCPHGFKGGLTA